MTPDRLRELREALAAATARPWVSVPPAGGLSRGIQIQAPGLYGPRVIAIAYSMDPQDDANTRLLPLLRNAAPELLDLIDRQRTEIERLRGFLWEATELLREEISTDYQLRQQDDWTRNAEVLLAEVADV